MQQLNGRRQDLEKLSIDLADAWKQQTLIESSKLPCMPVDRLEAYYVQDRMAAFIDEPLSGWKVGATSIKMQEIDGHSDVIPGRIFRSMTWKSAQVILPARQFPRARVEAEFAFRLLRDIPLRDDRWTADEIAEFAVLHPAVEIIGNRYTLNDASKEQNSLMTIADNGGGIGFVFGDPVLEWQEIAFRQLPILLNVDQGNAADNLLGEMRCQPIQAVADLVNHLSDRGLSLRAGHFVSTGAATVPQSVGAGSYVKADFGDLGSIKMRFE